jgi:hypothetical protein
MIMELGPVVFHTNLYKQLTVSDGGVVLFSAQFNVGGLMRLRINRRDALKLALGGGVATMLQA